jgi:hypothetical protein
MKQSSGDKGFIWRTKIALVYFRWVKFLWFLLWRERKIIQISVFIIWPADVWILSKFYWRLLWTWWILAKKLVLTDHSSQNHEIPSGWPLGLGIMNVRLRVLERLPASAAHPHSLHVASTSFSSFSSSNLDTEVTQTHLLLFQSFTSFFIYISMWSVLLLSKSYRDFDNSDSKYESSYEVSLV